MAIWLAVEDEADICELIMGMFAIWGINGMAFSDGLEVLQWLENVDNGQVDTALPELALIDIRLPETSGIEIAARIRKSIRLGNIPIVLMTAYRPTPNDIEQLMEQSGADMLIYKPLPHMLELRKMLDSLLEKKSHRFQV